MTTTHPGVARSPGRAAPVSLPSASVRRANTEAQKLTGRAYVSHSQLSLFRGCPRKFAFTYIEHVQPDHQPVSLLLGGAIHAAMESHFRRQLEGLSSDAGDLMHALHVPVQPGSRGLARPRNDPRTDPRYDPRFDPRFDRYDEADDHWR